MTKTKIFDIFGTHYKTVQFPAVGSLDLMGRMSYAHPMEVLSRTASMDKEGKWVALEDRASINQYVRDAAGVLPPILVLRGLTKVITEFSFGFAQGWKGIKIPPRFKSGVEPRSSKYVDPVIGQILQEGMASLRELEEYYSLEDAFKMFDLIAVKGVNAALAHEAATKGVKR